MNRDCFIYSITNVKTGRRYIGSALNTERRWAEHRSQLAKGKHHCSYLQNSWNKHGRDSFSFSIVLVLKSASKPERTLAELAEISMSPCFNSLIANSSGSNFESSAETRSKISRGLIEMYETNPARAKVHSEWMKKRYADQSIRDAHKETVRKTQTADVRAKMSKSAKAAWQSKSRKARPNNPLSETTLTSKSVLMKAYWASPEGQKVKARRSEKMRLYWSNPKSRLRNRKHVSKVSDPETRKARSETLKAIWADPDSAMHTKANGWDNPKARQRLSKSLKSAWADPNSKYHNMKSKRWSDPEAKKRASKKMKEAWARRKGAASD